MTYSSKVDKGNATGRVGVWLYPTTRNRLNKLKADLTFARGKVVTLDEAVNELMDHYLATAPKRDAQIVEFA
jgi:hypothetical protein